jgi:magnesium-transporting ATPase (P-type)
MKPATASPAPQARAWHALTSGRVLELLTADEERGLATSDAQQRLAHHGNNELRRQRGPSAPALFARQFADPIVYLLLGSAALAMALGKALDGAVVLGAVMVNAVIGFFQEFRAGKAIEALSRMVPHDANVIRDGRLQAVPSTSLVPGDMLVLASGDRVPADVRLLSSRNLQVDEAALTGESVPAQKAADPVAPDAAIADRRGMGFGGTLVTAGTARAVVVATGANTELGRISDMLQAVEQLRTPLTRAIQSLGKWLTYAVVAMAALLVAVSLWRGYALADAVMVAIALAVASIPEGLPAIITIALAIGVQRMAARNAVVRRLACVETLGSTTVICSDKTGTLTRNEMTTARLYSATGVYDLAGVGYVPRGELSCGGRRLTEPPNEVVQLLEAGVLCSDASVHGGGERWSVTGDPTEGALLVAAMKVGIDVDALRRSAPRLDVVPFESEHQFMVSLHAGPHGARAIIKGAPEVVLARCELSARDRADVMNHLSAMAREGMRVLAIAHKNVPASAATLHAACAEAGFELLGLQGLIDPPRPEAVIAVKQCRSAGITVKMITGDHLGTAEAIGRKLGLLSETENGLSGAEIARLPEDALRQAAAAKHVFARVAPEHKLRLVRALQEAGHVVAMTGDGVNDAPALKRADVGVAMGITGTAVSKEAADIVLADDNFATIVSAVEEGRRIYDNLIKSLAFVLPTNLGLGLILVASVAFFPVLSIDGRHVALMPLLPTQLLWINLVASVALSLPLAFEVREPDAMARPPRAPDAPMLGTFLILRTVLVAVLMAAGAIGLFLWEYWTDVDREGHTIAAREAQTMAVTTVIFFQMFYLLNCRSLRGSLLHIGLFSNRKVFVGIGVLLLLQAGFMYLPFMQTVFDTAPLPPGALVRAALLAATVLPLIAVEKAWRNRSAGKRGAVEAFVSKGASH